MLFIKAHLICLAAVRKFVFMKELSLSWHARTINVPNFLSLTVTHTLLFCTRLSFTTVLLTSSALKPGLRACDFASLIAVSFVFTIDNFLLETLRICSQDLSALSVLCCAPYRFSFRQLGANVKDFVFWRDLEVNDIYEGA